MKEQEKTPEELSRDKKFILYKVQANDLNKLKE